MKESYYIMIFITCFNLGFHRLYTDTCTTRDILDKSMKMCDLELVKTVLIIRNCQKS